MGTKSGELIRSELAADLKAIGKLEDVIHVKGRLAIVSVLAATESLTFTELRDALRLTDGNLAAHLHALERAGYARLRKDVRPAKPVTVISLTTAGRHAFSRYLEGLEYIVRRHR